MATNENVDKGFLGNGSFFFLIALVSAWHIILESSESLTNSLGVYSFTVIQPPADLSTGLINLSLFGISLIISSNFLVNCARRLSQEEILLLPVFPVAQG